MRPRATFSSFDQETQLPLIYRVADLQITKEFVLANKKIFDDLGRTVVAQYGITAQQYKHLRNFLFLKDNEVFPHKLFRHVYDESNAPALIDSFLTILNELPDRLAVLKCSYTNFFANRLADILDPSQKNTAFGAVDVFRLDESLADVPTYHSLTPPQKKLFLDIIEQLYKTAVNTHIATIKKSVNFQRCLQSATPAQLAQFDQIAADLDERMKIELVIIVKNYLSSLLVSYRRLQPSSTKEKLFTLLLQELKYRSPHYGFYNRQFDYPVTRAILIDILEKQLQPKLDQGLNLENAEESYYYLAILAKFSIEFQDVQLSKHNATDATYKLTSQITKHGSIQEKLIQFQALYALAEHYLNQHSNPVIDQILFINNTDTWKKLMAHIRDVAFIELVDVRNYRQPIQAENSQYLTTLRYARTLPLFSQHRDNYATFFYNRKTSTLQKIDALIHKQIQPIELASLAHRS